MVALSFETERGLLRFDAIEVVRLRPAVPGTGEGGGDENVVLREEGGFGDETVLLRRTPVVEVRSVVDVFALGALEPVREAP